MHPATEVMPHVIDHDNLLRAAKDASKSKRERLEVMEFNNHLAGNLCQIAQAFEDGSYESGPYQERYVRVPQTRLIQIAEFKDRVAQQALYGVLCPILEKQYYTHSYACREDKGAIKATQKLQSWLQLISRKESADKWVCGKLDIAKFFYRLDHDVVMEIFRQYVADEQVCTVVDHIIRCKHTPFGLPEGKKCTEVPKNERLYEVGVPIGSLMSQTMANMVLNEVDQFAKHQLHIHFYIRYMDDIVILAPDLETLHKWMAAIQDFVWKRLKLKCNHKTQVIPIQNGIPFVGRRVWNNRILPRKSTIKHMKRAVKHVCEKYSLSVIELEKAMETANSYYAYLDTMDCPALEEWIAENFVLVRHGREVEPEESIWLSADNEHEYKLWIQEVLQNN